MLKARPGCRVSTCLLLAQELQHLFLHCDLCCQPLLVCKLRCCLCCSELLLLFSCSAVSQGQFGGCAGNPGCRSCAGSIVVCAVLQDRSTCMHGAHAGDVRSGQPNGLVWRFSIADGLMGNDCQPAYKTATARGRSHKAARRLAARLGAAMHTISCRCCYFPDASTCPWLLQLSPAFIATRQKQHCRTCSCTLACLLFCPPAFNSAFRLPMQ